MRRALELSKDRDVPVASHAEDKTIGLQGSVRAGGVADALGVPGWEPAREWTMVERDVELSRRTGGHLHVCHVSTQHSIKIIRRAKSDGVKVTVEATPHHLTLTSDLVLDIGADAKMNPPLGDADDREALIEALADGTIDCIATDHAPHTPKEKSLGLERAPFGVVGLETSFAVCYTELVKKGRIDLSRLIEAMSRIPRKIFNLEQIGLFEGSRADLALVDLEREWIVDPEKFQSKGRSCPFAGMRVSGKVLMTMYRGEVRWRLNW
jgi:dihydroorotase